MAAAAAGLVESCVFCKILRGEIPSQRLHADDEVFAFLDINPLAVGHTVVIPRRHAERLEDLPAEFSAALGRTLGRLGSTVSRCVGAPGYNVLQNNGAEAGQVVPHVHFHLIPRRGGDGLGYRWNAKSADLQELAKLGDQIRAAWSP